jgi:translation initiation factor IF-1
MPETRGLEVAGTVKKSLPNALYRVELDGRHEVLAHAADEMRKNFIRLLAGDRVRVQLSPRDTTRGRITRRD